MLSLLYEDDNDGTLRYPYTELDIMSCEERFDMNLLRNICSEAALREVWVRITVFGLALPGDLLGVGNTIVKACT